eukprot:scaffold225290_cov20-Prasinocladus_malaysianus.AAC.1
MMHDMRIGNLLRLVSVLQVKGRHTGLLTQLSSICYLLECTLSGEALTANKTRQVDYDLASGDIVAR